MNTLDTNGSLIWRAVFTSTAKSFLRWMDVQPCLPSVYTSFDVDVVVNCCICGMAFLHYTVLLKVVSDLLSHIYFVIIVILCCICFW